MNGTVLLVSRVGSDHWSVPGGRVEKGESIREALAREFQEECGAFVVIGRPLLTLEHAFEKKGERIHEVTVYFSISLSSVEVGARETGMIFQWFPINSLDVVAILPSELRGVLTKIAKSEPLDPFLSTLD